MLKNILVKKVYATISDLPITGTVFGSGDLGKIVTVITNILIVVGFSLVVIFLAIGFIKFITSQGDKAQTESAQKTITYAVLGGVGLFIIFVIRSIIVTWLGLDSINTYVDTTV
ncbi:hypothetical protein K0B04_02390 [Patescibacteria group bacterium]|nr:hypothetical protein [Patescibacteria group bacterium]